MHEYAIEKNKNQIFKPPPTISKSRFLVIYTGYYLYNLKKSQKTEAHEIQNEFHFLPLLLEIHLVVVFIKFMAGYPCSLQYHLNYHICYRTRVGPA